MFGHISLILYLAIKSASDQVLSAVLEKHPGLADFMAKYKMRLM